MTLVPKSIDATGSREVTADLNSFLSQLDRGERVDFPLNGTYRCEEVVKLAAKTGVTLNFNGAKIFATTRAYRTRSHLLVHGCRDITLIRPRVKGANPYSGLDAEAYHRETEAQHGIEVLSTIGLTIDRPVIESVYGDFIAITRRGPTRPWSENVNVLAPYGRDNGRIGISVTAGRNVRVLAPNFARMRRSVFDCEPDSTSDGCDNFTVDGSTGGRIGSCHTGYLFASLGKAGIVSNITIKNLWCPDHAITAQVVSPEGKRTKRNIVIVDNRSEDRLERTGCRFWRVDGVVVQGNDQPMLPGVDYVTTNDCTGVTIQ